MTYDPTFCRFPGRSGAISGSWVDMIVYERSCVRRLIASALKAPRDDLKNHVTQQCRAAQAAEMRVAHLPLGSALQDTAFLLWRDEAGGCNSRLRDGKVESMYGRVMVSKGRPVHLNDFSPQFAPSKRSDL